MRAALAVVDLLVSLLPTEFRRSFGREIRADFLDRWNDCVEPQWGVRRTKNLMALLLTTFGNLLLTNITERIKSSVSRSREKHPVKSLSPKSTRIRTMLLRQTDSLIQDVRYAIRGLLRQPGFTAAVVILLAVAAPT